MNLQIFKHQQACKHEIESLGDIFAHIDVGQQDCCASHSGYQLQIYISIFVCKWFLSLRYYCMIYIYILFIQYQRMFQPTEDILLVYLVIIVHMLMRLSDPSQCAMANNSITTSDITGFNTHTRMVWHIANAWLFEKASSDISSLNTRKEQCP